MEKKNVFHADVIIRFDQSIYFCYQILSTENPIIVTHNVRSDHHVDGIGEAINIIFIIFGDVLVT